MSHIHPQTDPHGLYEYSVVFNDRSVNHMAQTFQETMRHLSRSLTKVYAAESLTVIPGGGTFAMEAIARQFAQSRRVLIIRNGWFSYRWSQILDAGQISASQVVMKARPVRSATNSAYAPPELSAVIQEIKVQKPHVVFAPHVETSAGLILPDDYIRSLADATHEAGGLFVLDCVASGTVWVNMKALGVDILLTAPQKGWSSSPGAGLILYGQRAEERLQDSQSSSFAMDLKKWRDIMKAYESGGHAYHATLPTDILMQLSGTIKEAEHLGFEGLAERQWQLGMGVRSMLEGKGFTSVAAKGFEAPSVLVYYTRDESLRKGQGLIKAGVQIAAGVPLMCDEPQTFSTFRMGLFGLDKLTHPERTIQILERALTESGY